MISKKVQFFLKVAAVLGILGVVALIVAPLIGIATLGFSDTDPIIIRGRIVTIAAVGVSICWLLALASLLVAGTLHLPTLFRPTKKQDQQV